MYHAIVRAKVRKLWLRVGAGNYQAAVDMAAPDLAFRFVGDTPISAVLSTREEFAAWFESLYELFPDLRLSMTDVVVKGWPWDTTVVTRLDVNATLADGSAYRNEAIQWVRLRWGRMVSDEVFEDTLAVNEACQVQAQR